MPNQIGARFKIIYKNNKLIKVHFMSILLDDTQKGARDLQHFGIKANENWAYKFMDIT